MAWDEFDVAEPILKESVNICDFDLIAISQNGSREHRQAIVSRKKLTSAVAEALIESDDAAILEQLLRNEGIVFSQRIMAALADKSEKYPSLQSLLINRAELMPVLAYSIFWVVPSPLREKILKRFSVSRRMVQQTIADAVTEGVINLETDDPHEKEALQFLIGKEHVRSALADDILADLRAGNTDETIRNIIKGAEISKETAQRIFEDSGGEALAVLCKAINLGRSDFAAFARCVSPRADEPGDAFTGKTKCCPASRRSIVAIGGIECRRFTKTVRRGGFHSRGGVISQGFAAWREDLSMISQRHVFQR